MLALWYPHIPVFYYLFHNSIIPLFHHSIIPSFHHSIIPLFHYSIVPLFHYHEKPVQKTKTVMRLNSMTVAVLITVQNPFPPIWIRLNKQVYLTLIRGNNKFLSKFCKSTQPSFGKKRHPAIFTIQKKSYGSGFLVFGFRWVCGFSCIIPLFHYSLFRYSIIRYFVISLFRYFVISLFRYFIISLFRYFVISLFRYFVISLAPW
jgi:hypothetical protein